MDNGKVDWRGCFPAVVTPFTKEGEIDDVKTIVMLQAFALRALGPLGDKVIRSYRGD